MLLGSWGCRQDLGDVTPAGKSCVPIRLSRAPPPRASGRSLGGFPHSPCTPPPRQIAPLSTLAPALQPSCPPVLSIHWHLACGRCLCSAVWGPGGGASGEGVSPHTRAHSPWGPPLAPSAGSRLAGLEEVGSNPWLLACSEAACSGRC